MTILEQVAAMCRRLAPKGWGRLLAVHGLRLDSSTLNDPRKLAKELKRTLSGIDRTVKGFEDFSPAGSRGIEGGRPGCSLLYHALASPMVHPFIEGMPDGSYPDDSYYPTLRELDTLENYIYTCTHRRASFAAGYVVGVFAYQYRIGVRTPNGKFADLAFSRTGIARVGTSDAVYENRRRSFWPIVEGSPNDIAVMPARYAAFLAEWRSPGPQDAIMGEQPDDNARSFLFPVHKLFDGKECLRGVNLHLRFSELHRNEKLRKIHTEQLVAFIEGFDMTKAPFVRQSDDVTDLVEFRRAGASVLLLPVPHKQMARYAIQRNAKSRRNEIARFRVPPEDASGDNRFADSSFQYLDPTHAERRSAPEYLNIRHRVDNPKAGSPVADVGRIPRRKTFLDLMKAGGYEAAHFVDDTCEGSVTVDVTNLPLTAPDENFAAYSLVSAPDFFPLVDQADVIDWIDRVLRRNGEREHFAQGGPRPLSHRRHCINPHLLRRSPRGMPVSPVRDGDNARTETLTAIVAASSSRKEGVAPQDGHRYQDPSTAFLPDAASGIFDPGWDISYSGNNETDFFASFGLGNPFPEDSKLCAALNSYWPAVAPDATRTFGLCPPDWEATTSIPLMDDELGYHPRHPLVRARKVRSRPGWDGEFGPFFGTRHAYVNYADIARSDYVTHALERRFTLARLAVITPSEFFRRMNAMRACIYALPVRPKRVSSTPLFLVSAKRIRSWDKRLDRADPRLSGEGYLFQFARLTGDEIHKPSEIGRVRRKVREWYTCQIGMQGVCWRREAAGKRFAFQSMSLAV
jgi:hypothetical protein